MQGIGYAIHLLHEEILLNVESKPTLMQLFCCKTISVHPITCHLRRETSALLSAGIPFQVVVKSDEVSPQPPFLQTRRNNMGAMRNTGLSLPTCCVMCCFFASFLLHEK